MAGASVLSKGGEGREGGGKGVLDIMQGSTRMGGGEGGGGGCRWCFDASLPGFPMCRRAEGEGRGGVSMSMLTCVLSITGPPCRAVSEAFRCVSLWAGAAQLKSICLAPEHARRLISL